MGFSLYNKREEENETAPPILIFKYLIMRRFDIVRITEVIVVIGFVLLMIFVRK